MSSKLGVFSLGAQGDVISWATRAVAAAYRQILHRLHKNVMGPSSEFYPRSVGCHAGRCGTSASATRPAGASPASASWPSGWACPRSSASRTRTACWRALHPLPLAGSGAAASQALLYKQGQSLVPSPQAWLHALQTAPSSRSLSVPLNRKAVPHKRGQGTLHAMSLLRHAARAPHAAES